MSGAPKGERIPRRTDAQYPDGKHHAGADRVIAGHQFGVDGRKGEPITRESVLARFEAKVNRTLWCWEWAGAKMPKGYGQFVIARIDRYAHRASWRLFRGPIPDGMRVLHRCDNPGCVRPDHLFLGTQADNVADMWAKGRASRPPRSSRRSTP